MSRYTWLVGSGAVVGMAAALTLGNACSHFWPLWVPDPLYCDEPGQCKEEGYVCDLEGITPASEGHGRTCVPVDQACIPGCTNPAPVCRDVMVCETCTVNEQCPTDTPYCNGNGSCVECLPDNTGCSDTSLCNPDGFCVTPCQNNDECSEPTPICRDQLYCVQCVLATDCSPGEICSPAGNCEACTEHAQCQSGICDETGGPGRCLDAGEIVYVDNQELGAEDMEGCGTGDQKPCQTIAYAVDEARTQARTWVHVAAGTYTGAVTISGGQTVHIVGAPDPDADPAPAVQLTAAAGIVLDAQDAGTNVYVEGLAIQGGTSATVNCAGGKLRMYRSRVTGGGQHGVSANDCELLAERVLVSNSGGIGVLLDSAPFTLRNAVIMDNGGPAIERRNSAAGQPAILEFSTIVRNNTGNNAGLSCDMPTISISHIILSNGATSALNEVGGCFTIGAMQDDYSFIRGRNDINGLAEDGYHLTAGSAAVNAGALTPPADITEDFDGEPRPNGRIDVGADEYHPASARRTR
jgi:hypothetical protein